MNMFLVLGMSGIVGFLSEMFGVGGGFLMTPLLIFTGIPPAVTVATEANQIVASSVSGSIAQWRRRNVDVKMGLVLLAGGVVGSVIGVELVKVLRQSGQVDLVISLSYVFFLDMIGTLMLIEAVQTYFKSKAGGPPPGRRRGQITGFTSFPSRCASSVPSSTSVRYRPFLLVCLLRLWALAVVSS